MLLCCEQCCDAFLASESADLRCDSNRSMDFANIACCSGVESCGFIAERIIHAMRSF